MINKGIENGIIQGVNNGIIPQYNKVVTRGYTIAQRNKLINANSIKLWLKASSGITLNGSNVSSWIDGVNGYNAAQSNSTFQPAFVANALNGKPVIRFDGNNDYIKISSFIYSNPNTVYIVYKQNSNANQIILSKTINTLFVQNDSNLLRLYAGTTQVGTALNQPFNFVTAGIIINGASSKVGVNGVWSGNLNPGIGAFDSTLSIGWAECYSAYWFTGDVAEIIIFNKELSLAERIVWEFYFKTEYAHY